MADNEVRYNEIVGVRDGELVVLEYVFQDGIIGTGATGYAMGTVTQEYIDEMNDENRADDMRYTWVDCVKAGMTDEGLHEWWEEAIEEAQMEDLLYPFDDSSYRGKTNELYDSLPSQDRAKIEEVLGVKGEDFAEFQISSCGRTFNEDDKWDVVIRQDLIDLIKACEKRAK